MKNSIESTTAPDFAVGDTDWSAYDDHNHLDLDLTALLVEAARVAQMAAIMRSVPLLDQSLDRQLPSWPPGRAGMIARFLFCSSYSPIPEVAIAATLALFAGVCGRAYRTPTDKDLALYIIFVAKSGVGKDAMHDGIPMMLEMSGHPLARDFLRSQDFASGEALHKSLLKGPGFLYIQGEFGRKLKRMATPTDAPMQTFRTVMTNAYAKRYLEGKAYSNAADSLEGVDFPALSFLGETTPATFLECLTPDMMQDGFLSRFLIISYGGGKPRPNRQRSATLSSEHLDAWRDLVGRAAKSSVPFSCDDATVVRAEPAAEAWLDAFDEECRDKLNATEDEAERPVWTRAHIKALKVACLLAVADDCALPVVTTEHARWATDLVRNDIDAFRIHCRDGEVGSGDNARERKLLSLIRAYIVRPYIPAGYKVPAKMHHDGIIPRSYLQMSLSSSSQFTNHRLGAAKALDDTLRSLVTSGWIMECKQSVVVEAYGHHGKAYRLLNAPD